MKKFTYIAALLCTALFGSSCEPDVEGPSFTPGPLNFNHYVAYGDYYTAGWTNGGLSSETQQVSYPSILANQFAKVGGPETFIQPLFSAGNSTGQLRLSGFTANGRPIIVRDANTASRGPLMDASFCDTGFDSVQLYNQYSSNLSEVQNLGIPGLRLTQINTPGLGNTANINGGTAFNPYYERILPANSDTRYIELVTQSRPTFFTAWFGLGDLMPYILSGGTCTIPTEVEFKNRLNQMLDSILVKNPEARGAIADIPNFRSLPLSRMIDPIALQEQIRQQQSNQEIDIWINAARPFPQIRRITADDVLLTQVLAKIGQPNAAGLPYGLDSLNAIADTDVLDGREVSDRIENFIQKYNTVIRNIATDKKYIGKVITVGINSLFIELSASSTINGVTYSNNFISGGFFSLDGYSLTPRGSAIVANEFIEAMNNRYDAKNLQRSGFGSIIPRVNPNNFEGIQYP